MTYKITERVLTLVQDLFDAGYDGEATLTNSYCTGTASYFETGQLSIQLTGGCKECFYLVDNIDTGEMSVIGRYSLELEKSDITVPDIVSVAWQMYKCYKDSGYSMPHEFKDMFINSGYIKQKTVTKTVWEEQ